MTDRQPATLRPLPRIAVLDHKGRRFRPDRRRLAMQQQQQRPDDCLPLSQVEWRQVGRLVFSELEQCAAPPAASETKPAARPELALV